MVLHVAGALHALGVEIALELGEDLAVGLADDVGEDVQPAPVRHPEHRLLDAALGRLVQDGIEQRDRRLGSFEPEALLADVAGVQEALEGLGRVQALEDVMLLLGREGARHTFDVLLDPALLLGVLDVHVLDADGSAVGVAKRVEDVTELELGVVAESLDDEAPIEVEDGDAVRQRVELGVQLGCHGPERVEVGHEVTAHPVQVDELLDPRLFDEPAVDGLAGTDRIDVLVPPRRVVGNAEGEEDLVVEAVLADQQLVHRVRNRPDSAPWMMRWS